MSMGQVESNKCMYVCIRDSPYRSFAVSSNSQLSVNVIFIFFIMPIGSKVKMPSSLAVL